MGVEPALAEGAIRVSFGWNSTEADVTRFLAAFAASAAALSSGGGGRQAA
jgi:cysteine desulfurase